MTARLIMGALLIAAGLGLRAFGPGLGLPFVITKYGGSLLWATFVFWLIALSVRRWPPWQHALTAGAFAVAIEFFRLVNAPWLDDFRLTTIGALLLGRVFSLWNLVAYAAGITVGVAVERVMRR